MNSNTFIASHCVCCGRRLTDELSIQVGMGPVCRKGHGFEARDAESDWGRALGLLGSSAPADLYDAIVDAYGVLAMRGVPPMSLGFTSENYTSFKDAKKAIRVLTQRLSTAIARGIKRHEVIRIIAAVHALGFVRLARTFSKGFRRRRDFRDTYQIQSVDVVRQLQIEERYVVSATYNTTFLDRMRAKTPWSDREFNKITKEYSIKCSRAVLWDILTHSGFDLLSGISTKFGVEHDSIPIHDAEFVKFNQMNFENEPHPARQWEPEGAEEDRVWWVDEHGAAVRVVIPGEASHRPGMEKVSAEFFARPISSESLVHDPDEDTTHGPPAGSWADVAREMVRDGLMTGDEADAWKDEMKEMSATLGGADIKID